MNRLLATAAVLGLLAGPTWAQTMNSAPADTATPMTAPDQPAAPQAQAPAQSAPAQSAKPDQAMTQSSGSSARPAAKAKGVHPGDNSADELNRQELQQLSK